MGQRLKSGKFKTKFYYAKQKMGISEKGKRPPVLKLSKEPGPNGGYLLNSPQVR